MCYNSKVAHDSSISQLFGRYPFLGYRVAELPTLFRYSTLNFRQVCTVSLVYMRYASNLGAFLKYRYSTVLCTYNVKTFYPVTGLACPLDVSKYDV